MANHQKQKKRYGLLALLAVLAVLIGLFCVPVHADSYTSWSAWSDVKPDSKSGREIETRDIVTKYQLTVYLTQSPEYPYYRQFRSYSVKSIPSLYRQSYGEFHYTATCTPAQLNAAEKIAAGAFVSTGVTGYNKDTKLAYKMGDDAPWFLDGVVERKTQYRYRDVITTPAEIVYRTNMQTSGWQNWVKDGSVSGLPGKSRRMEAVEAKLQKTAGGVSYRTFIAGDGWQGWKANGAMAGTTGQSKRIEIIQVKLTGAVASKYDVYYRVYTKKFGWQGWAKNGASAGISGFGAGPEAVQMKLVKKGGSAPGSTSNPYIAGYAYKGIVTNATNGATLSGVTLKIRKGQNVKTGSVYTTATTKSTGAFDARLQKGNYTAEFGKSGFITLYVNITISGTLANQSVSLSPVMKGSTYRIVLTWGSTPKDLDSHLTGSNGSGGYFHTYWSGKTGYYKNSKIAWLDVDDRSSYGPETITLDLTKNPGGKFIYYVHDWTNRSRTASRALSASGATVNVYRGSTHVATYKVPTGKAGTAWKVFGIVNGRLVKYNTMSNISNATDNRFTQ